MNVQNQQKIVWPATLVVAKAYVDQLSRSQGLPSDEIAALQKAIQDAESSHLSKSSLSSLKKMASSVQKSASTAKTPADSSRLHSLAEILKHPAA
jgi:hypothetical protein